MKIKARPLAPEFFFRRFFEVAYKMGSFLLMISSYFAIIIVWLNEDCGLPSGKYILADILE